MAEPSYIHLPQVGSTSTWLKEHADEVEMPCVVSTDCQTGGRGQRGNTWEAEPGKNLTFSILFKPQGIEPAEQFRISEAVCLGVVDVLRRHLPEPDAVKVKWPNDVYVADKKICGILIEHSLESATEIRRTVAGVGVNVNQKSFRSDAPNPVSMRMLSGETLHLEPLLKEFVTTILQKLKTPPDELHSHYLATLWRSEGLHPYATPDGTRFEASIVDINPNGILTLRRSDGTENSYLFKEVQFIL